jgi:uncharacterized protein (DUF1800 family)
MVMMLGNLFCALLLALPAQTTAGQEAPPLLPRERAVHLLNRLAFGPAPGDVDRLLAMGEQAWLDEQLRAAPAQDPRLAEALAKFETLDMSPAGVSQWVYQDYLARGMKEEDLSEEERQQLRERRRQPGHELIHAVLYRAVLSDRRAEEVLADFWRNHFNVSFTKGDAIEVQINDYERMVLRRNLFGKFPDMLAASARHAAMLNYLDNAVSRRPPSKQELAEIERNVKRRTGSEARAAEEVQIAAERGLNENYAREVMELHTLGVDNGYDQDDVVALAEALTGWTYDAGRRASQEFVFRGDMHVDGDKRVLGKNFPEDKEGGPGQGEAILTHLAEHKNTARFIATKLTRYLVNDEAPSAVVDAAAKVFLKTDGDIPATVRAIVASEEFWARENFEAKFKTPYEFVVSAVRATGAEIIDARVLTNTLEGMNQPVYYCDDPTGWYDTAEAWLDPGVLALRWQFAMDLAEGRLRGVKIPETFWQVVPDDAPPELWQHHLTLLLLPEGAGERTRAALATVTGEYLAKKKVPDVRELGPQLVGLLLGSPEFQKQ